MAIAPSTELTTLFVHFLDVCNTALAANRSSFPYKQLIAAWERVFSGRDIAVQVYDHEPALVTGVVTLRFENSSFQPIPENVAKPAFSLKLKRSYMEKVVENRQDYISRPEKLDWDWLRSRFSRETGSESRTHGTHQTDVPQARDLMTPNVVAVGADDKARYAAELMRNQDVGLLPVIDGATVVGMVTDRDITTRICAEGMDPTTTPIRRAMTPGVITCPEDAAIKDIAWTMENLKVRRLLVVDRDSRPVGVISMGDLAARSPMPELASEVVAAVSTPDRPMGY